MQNAQVTTLPKVSIIMGSGSDYPTMQKAERTLMDLTLLGVVPR